MHQVAFYLGGYPIHWYGLAWGLTFLWMRFMPVIIGMTPKMDRESWYEFIDYGLIALVIGGRLGWFIFYNPGPYHISELFKLWHGGMSFHGALISGSLYMWCYARMHQYSALILSDHISLWLPPAIGCVRVANYINGEVCGRVTDSWFGVVFIHVDPLLRHPSQLYEAVAEGLLLWLVVLWARNKLSHHGQLSAVAITFYASARLLIEMQFREPSYEWSQLLSTGQLLCIAMLISGIALWRIVTRQPQSMQYLQLAKE